LSQIAGAARSMPWTMSAMVVAGLSLIGVPGTAGFISKWYLLSAALDEGLPGIALVVVIVLGSLMAVVYIWRIIEAAWFATPAEPQQGEGAIEGEAPLAMLLVTWAAALANIVFGLFTDVPRQLAADAAASLLGHLP